MTKENTITEIGLLTGKISLLSGLHIGGGDAQMKIGGIDNEVVKDVKDKPFIPGSSLKGKMRNLLEWYLDFYDDKTGEPSNHEMIGDMELESDLRVHFLRLFGSHKGNSGIVTRLSFWDCKLEEQSTEDDKEYCSESKAENSINRKTGTADNPRNMARVPVGNKFKFKLTLKIFQNDDKDLMLVLIKGGLKLLEMDSIGGSGSRGYGKIQFESLEFDNSPFDNLQQEDSKKEKKKWDLSTDDCLTDLKKKLA